MDVQWKRASQSEASKLDMAMGGEWWKSRLSLDGQKPKMLMVQETQCPLCELVARLASTFCQ